MTVATMRAVEAAAPVCSGAAKFATALIAQMLVVLVGAVQTARTKSGGVTKATRAHRILNGFDLVAVPWFRPRVPTIFLFVSKHLKAGLVLYSSAGALN
jgi:L-alanine-DL-glutamate epimerase-like enolase superfamily enzyme